MIWVADHSEVPLGIETSANVPSVSILHGLLLTSSMLG